MHKQEESFLQIIESLKKYVGVYGELNQEIGILRENVSYVITDATEMGAREICCLINVILRVYLRKY